MLAYGHSITRAGATRSVDVLAEKGSIYRQIIRKTSPALKKARLKSVWLSVCHFDRGLMKMKGLMGH